VLHGDCCCVYTLCFWLKIYLFSLYCDAYRIPSAFPELKPYATYVHSTCQSNIVYAYERNCQGACRPNFTNLQKLWFYQNDIKIRQKLAYEMYSCVQLLGGFAPRPPDQGFCPWTPLGAQPPDPHYSPPPMLKPNSAYGWIDVNKPFVRLSFFLRFTHVSIHIITKLMVEHLNWTFNLWVLFYILEAV